MAAARWAVDVYAWEPGAAEWAYLIGLLPADEAERVCHFVFRDDQKRALVSRLMQRRCAQEVLCVRGAASVPIGRTKGGKPFVRAAVARPAAAPNFNFNVSHEGAWVVLASEPSLLVGVDVAAPQEARRRRPPPDGSPAGAIGGQGGLGTGGAGGARLAQLFDSLKTSLSAKEWSFVRSRPTEPEQEAAFRQLWSLKEAYIKARGDGLAFSPLSRAEFEIGVGTATGRVDGEELRDWSFALDRLPGDHWVSVARGPPAAMKDELGEFAATMARPHLSEAECAAAHAAPRGGWELRQIEAVLTNENVLKFIETYALGSIGVVSCPASFQR
ncbi:hypothetical protein T492DRAFT_916452 [Pavlovales sp. CCMP2436]|nr:hypothetical protein T492DRAFT_916452 [Pavlovales sp. CCMP2436]